MAEDMIEDPSHTDPRLTVDQGMELIGIQFEEGCGRTVCVDVWGENCHCMDTLCKQFPGLTGKRIAINARAQGVSVSQEQVREKD